MKEIEINDSIIYNSDVLEGLKKIEDDSIDLIFLDPPYNLGKNYSGNGKDKWDEEKEYLNWCYTWLNLCIDKLKDSGSIYFMASTQFMPYFDLYLRKKLHIMSRIIWHYDSSGVQAKNHFGSLYEPILFMVKRKTKYTFNHEDIMIETNTGAKRNLIDYRKNPPKPYNKLKVPGNLWYFPRVRYKMPEYEKHPSQKPEVLLERIIKVSSNVGDVVLDPFSGTFTTGSVCQKLNRKFIGIEISEEYVNIGVKRLQKGDDYGK